MFCDAMHIDIVPNRNSRPAYLLREGKRVTKRTQANLSALPVEQIEMIRRVLKGERLGPQGAGFEGTRSQHHGHADAVRTAMTRLGFEALLDQKKSRARDLVAAMAAERIITPDASKLGMIPAFADTTLADDPGAAGAGEAELCERWTGDWCGRAGSNRNWRKGI